jgi:hypothetical protein
MYADKLDWDSLSSNWHLFWTEEMINSFKDTWNWEKIE